MWFWPAHYEGGWATIARTDGVLALSDTYADGALNKSSCRTLPGQAGQWRHSGGSSDRIDFSSTLTAFLVFQRTQWLKATAAAQCMKTCVSGCAFLRSIVVSGNPG
jgi:hypothetical protein